MLEDLNAQLGTSNILWRLEDLYHGPDDPRIEKDMDTCREMASRLSAEYGGKIASLDADSLLRCVKELERLSSLLARLSAFAYLNFSTRVNAPETGAFLQKVKEFSSAIGKEVVFFDLEWAKVPDEKADALLSAPCLADYEHYLRAARRYRPHLLSEPEEKLLIEFSPVGHTSWVSLFEKVLAMERYGESGRTQEEVLSDLYSHDRKVRKKAAQELTYGLKKDLHVLTHTFNTVLGEKMIEDRVRRYPEWISSMNLSNEVGDNTVDALIEAVTGRYDIVRRYYNIKKKILGLDTIYDYDRYAPLPYMPRKQVSWEECRRRVLDSFGRFSREMEGIARDFFDKKWIHAPVGADKTSGAFAHPVVPEVHPYVLVNYTGNLRDVETVAHELGHGVHQVLAGKKGYFNSQTPLVLAETASVFGEMLVYTDIMADLEGPEERLGLAAAKIESIFATVFRQIAMNRFEDAVHHLRRTQGELSAEDFSRIWLDTQERMFEESVTLTEDYGVWWSYIGHFIHAPGYVYAYAFGELLVLSLFSMYRQGSEGFVERYMDLLRAGGSDTPYALLRPLGIDLRDPGFWGKGLDMIDEMVRDAQELADSII